MRLADVIRAAGLKGSAVFTGHYGADTSLADASKPALSRGVPIRKAIDQNNLIVWAMNGEPLPNIHGGPVRLIIPGWPGSLSAKWLTRIWVRDREHDGPGMGGTSYRVAIKPMIPGDKPDMKNFRDLESMPVRSIITSPANGAKLSRARARCGCAAPPGTATRRSGASMCRSTTARRWRPAQLQPPKNRYDWRRWTATVPLPSDGYYEIWTRATDQRGSHAAACRRQLESAGLRRQPDAPDRGADRL